MDGGALLVKSLTKVTKEWTRQRKAEERNHAAQLRRLDALTNAQRITIKEAAWSVMPQAYLKASGNGRLPAHARQIMYAARPHILAMTGIETLDDQYFCQTLLPDFIDTYPDKTAGWDVVFDARGHFHEPHTDRSVDLGTLAVRQYLANVRHGERTGEVDPESLIQMFPTMGPEHRYSAILFCEKEGFFPLFEQVELARRYDIAIMSTKGMSNVAARRLVDEICGEHGVKLLIMRDFDKAGFSIAATIQRHTRRYLFTHDIEAIDLGVRLADVNEYGLASEDVYHGKTDPSWNLGQNGATQEEIDFLVDTRRSGYGRYVGRRVELNEFTSPRLIEWLEAKLKTHGIAKVLPDKVTLVEAYQRAYIQKCCAEAAQKAKAEALEAVKSLTIPDDLEQQIRDGWQECGTDSWDQVLMDIVADADNDGHEADQPDEELVSSGKRRCANLSECADDERIAIKQGTPS